MAELLDDEEIQSRLPEGWERDGEEITRTFEFDDYLEGVDFAREVGELAEKEFHHPEMIVGYEEVEVRFTSHEEGGITDQDIEMAERVNDEG
ncbi:4a-hydroxytetrahydrobiopterin dehydratase [Halalkalicoccus jeotgali]|uniref:Putative pterin-4-alpha-carbinolamine dehydratase n=1 Tax=Halalkalicoccus jeotgali (strain DSM 18796 / CECT 7217 / JCM 14584 / KCTC 4019 / B3) TaxID=795797 RepID=D8JA90_HALJB|nr:4a-hydroxytetrahydrobiopterin dehydratase [Halalkalicoccus jeotgali]ADJ14612.1 pterin-4-alpha-carbinolamine dehydratase [Halalkalicoccus jeotgali B3]ELY39985.1 pterin-4-alpha-carbinolamine dehydratase [Halalkalicoccus jeotgali B3]